MQLDAPMRERYAREAPELLDAVTEDGGGYIMRRDPQTDRCVRLEEGLCGIHRQYGTEFLGDACHFYPRVTRRLGETVLMTAVPSCPEVSRLALLEGGMLTLEAGAAERLPASLKNYLPPELSADAAVVIHTAFLQAPEDMQMPLEHIFARIFTVARSLEALPVASWPEAVPFYLATADARLPAPESRHEDPFNLLHALCGLAVASRKKPPPRLLETVRAMEQALHVHLDWEAVSITTQEDSLAHWLAIKNRWQQEWALEWGGMLRRWLQLQLSVAMFPFAGLGRTPAERITLIGVRMATFKLALMCACAMHEGPLPPEEAVRIAQSLSRLLDHLADPSFSFQVYTDAGWLREARMRGLVLL